jgi:hypothetical protein
MFIWYHYNPIERKKKLNHELYFPTNSILKDKIKKSNKNY